MLLWFKVNELSPNYYKTNYDRKPNSDACLHRVRDKQRITWAAASHKLTQLHQRAKMPTLTQLHCSGIQVSVSAYSICSAPWPVLTWYFVSCFTARAEVWRLPQAIMAHYKSQSHINLQNTPYIFNYGMEAITSFQALL